MTLNWIERFMEKRFALISNVQKKVWLVNCDRISRVNDKEVQIIGGIYNKYHCPCDSIVEVDRDTDIETYKFTIVDLTK